MAIEDEGTTAGPETPFNPAIDPSLSETRPLGEPMGGETVRMPLPATVLGKLDAFNVDPLTPEGTMGSVARQVAAFVDQLDKGEALSPEEAVHALNALDSAAFFWHGADEHTQQKIEEYMKKLKIELYGTEDIAPVTTSSYIGGELAKNGKISASTTVEWKGAPIVIKPGYHANVRDDGHLPIATAFTDQFGNWYLATDSFNPSLKKTTEITDVGSYLGRQDFANVNPSQREHLQHVSNQHMVFKLLPSRKLGMYDVSTNGTTVETRSYPEPKVTEQASDVKKSRLASVRERLGL